ncbi:NADH-quinone oxidoreductase subunit E [Roseibacterium sp. SDUM158017]|uniref:NADH-quinone oxidoreductase subunit E n=1 Tax=Roseicyclus salinarum TaxID=3036773 RepID=UPI002415572E|nr:NADH-quinone oxidoreductase subunit E [Roseibacterium sp. SDUM158017]MDG4649094.1 NADH-quinone oxidoreductase subunit E [Roseibacterium sp. SDUM158017]
MLRRLHPEQPESFAFTPDNLAWAKAQITKYPEGRQASAIIPLLWRAQEQEGWLTRPAIEHVCDMLGMAHIRGLEVATFYFMFQLQPVGSVAHVQVCGTTSCMICGAEDLIGVCRDKIAKDAHKLSDDGRFSWEEVECLGACANAPMVQIGKDYYEDLTAEKLGWIIDEMAAGRVPVPGPQNGRYASEPASGLTSLTANEAGRDPLNASARLAEDIGDTIKRIDGTEVPLRAPWGRQSASDVDVEPTPKKPVLAGGAPTDATGIDKREAPVQGKGHPRTGAPAEAADTAGPERLDAPRAGREADDLKRIGGVGPKIERMLNEMGIYHFDQIAAWTEDDAAWVDARLKFRGRIEREGWIEQARTLATES